MNMQIDFKRHSKSQFLSPEQIEEFGAKVDAIRREVMDDLGEKDAEYIYKIRNFVRYSEIASRGMLMFAGWLPPVWLAGTGLLGLSKIVENIGTRPQCHAWPVRLDERSESERCDL